MRMSDVVRERFLQEIDHVGVSMDTAVVERPAVAGERACGYRGRGGIYVEVGLSPMGKPLETYLVDEPMPVPEGLHIPDRGVMLLEIGGAWHIVDRVGMNNYPNVLDVLEEGRVMGFSRRVQHTLDFSKLTPDSRLMLVHDRGYVVNAMEYWNPGVFACPTGKHRSPRDVQCCCAVWWHDMLDGQWQDAKYGDVVHRYLPSVRYFARIRPPGVAPVYKTAFIASLPISRLVVVDWINASANLMEMRQQMRQQTTIPVEGVER